jgi:hypothetical protein
VAMKNAFFWDITSCDKKVTRIGELGTTIALTRNRRTLRSVRSVCRAYLH